MPLKNGITFYLHLFITIRAETLDNRHRAACCPSYISMAVILLIDSMSAYDVCFIKVCPHTMQASSISVWPHTSIHLSMAAYFHPSQYGRILPSISVCPHTSILLSMAAYFLLISSDCPLRNELLTPP